MGRIVVLDQNMTNMIAAGEVIERPASVVKELMENSIDAGATKITVTIEDGGCKLISIADNGTGMDAEDLGQAFESHATSKIKTQSDLQGISTLGFRGEALASIASVAQIKATSRIQGAAGANCIEIDCGDKGDVNPCSGDYGTTIQVRDLFYKLPARRKFLRTANTEMRHITEQFTRIALANGNLDMTLISNGRELYRLTSNENFRQRITELFSAEISENLIETESREKGLGMFALLGKPNISRTNSKFQYTFLNGRFIRDKFISHAIKEAYRGSLEANRLPVIFMFIQMPPEDYDVNVHPTKIEVRFFNSNLVHSQILACLREKLLGTNLDVDMTLPASDPTKTGFEGQGGGFTGTQRNQKINNAMAEFFKRHRPAGAQQQISFGGGTVGTGQLYTKFPPSTTNAIQIHDSFIVTETDEGLIIIDQHALHERIMYEDLRKRISEGKLESQKLLIPESFQLTDAQADALQNNAEVIEKLGIELVPFGPKTMAVQSFPTLLVKASPVDFVQDLLDLLADKAAAFDAERMLDEVLNMAACKAAIKAGQKLSDSEMGQLLADKEKIEHSSRCPHGRPTTINFSITELEKQFKRT
ncbi:MAG: DNA mismatch repair endonuclease MutL [Planctomycetes bacterium]|nr:DNA mismatch repair endonuclease MutL [Planctomycetota bacterium]